MYSIKKYKFCIIILLLFYLNSEFLLAQNTSPESIVKKIAKRVMDLTTFQLVDSETQKKYTSVENLTTAQLDNIRVQTPFSRWEYPNGVTITGLIRLAEVFKDPTYMKFVSDNFEFIFRNLPYYRIAYQKNKKVEWFDHFRMDRLDDCGSMGAGLAEVNQLNYKKEYDDYLKLASDYMLTKQTRLSDGTFSRRDPHDMTIWADDLYMSVPFLARMGKFTGPAKYFDEAIKQVENFNKYLYDAPSGLFWHCWYSNEQTNGVAHWLRCNGWVAMAQTELLNKLPNNHPKRKELIAFLQRQIIGFSRYQDASGLWHQVIDKENSYLETSGTAMFVYTIAKAVNEGWIDKTYLTIGQNGWNGLVSKITNDGQIEDVCIGTNVEDNLLFYFSRPKKLNDFHATGAVLLAGTEMYRANLLKKIRIF
jgi:rhamnogalacturonyl hydrolase YesR